MTNDDKTWQLLMDRIFSIEKSIEAVHRDVKEVNRAKLTTDAIVEKRISKIEMRITVIATAIASGVSLGAEKMWIIVKGLF